MGTKESVVGTRSAYTDLIEHFNLTLQGNRTNATTNQINFCQNMTRSISVLCRERSGSHRGGLVLKKARLQAASSQLKKNKGRAGFS